MSNDYSKRDVITVQEEPAGSSFIDIFNQIDDFSKKVVNATEKAERAQIDAKNAQVKVGIGKKVAIELLQEAVKQVADGLVTCAEAHQMAFENQTKLAQVAGVLLTMGMGNMVLTRSIIMRLESLLADASDASDADFSSFAKQELFKVLRQLKAQEDIMNKQERLAERIKKQQEQQAIFINKIEKLENATKNQFAVIGNVFDGYKKKFDDLSSSIQKMEKTTRRDMKREVSDRATQLNNDLCGKIEKVESRLDAALIEWEQRLSTTISESKPSLLLREVLKNKPCKRIKSKSE